MNICAVIRKNAVIFAITACLLTLPACVSPNSDGNGEEPIIEGGNRRPDYNYTIHYATAGDTLYSIGRRFDVRWEDIQELNRIDQFNLEVGQILLIPRGSHSTPQAPAPDAGKTPDGPAAKTGRAGGRWIWPVDGRIIREYGERLHGLPEPGITISAPANADVAAIADGVVICVIRRPDHVHTGWGNVVAIRHERDMVSWYAHLNFVHVREGARVRQGDVIGAVGRTGAAENYQLALRLFRNERPVDPRQFFP